MYVCLHYLKYIQVVIWHIYRGMKAKELLVLLNKETDTIFYLLTRDIQVFIFFLYISVWIAGYAKGSLIDKSIFVVEHSVCVWTIVDLVYILPKLSAEIVSLSASV
mgnify:FL=1